MTREKYGIREIIKKILSLIIVLLYPCMFMYFQNIGEGNFLEIFEAVLVFIILNLAPISEMAYLPIIQ